MEGKVLTGELTQTTAYIRGNKATTANKDDTANTVICVIVGVFLSIIILLLVLFTYWRGRNPPNVKAQRREDGTSEAYYYFIICF